MVKYISKDRLANAIRQLAKFPEQANKQRLQQLIPLLALKRAGATTEGEIQYEESDDYAFWNTFFLIDEQSANGRYYDPFLGQRRVDSHPHSNAATARKNTFANRWHAGVLRQEDGEAYWKLAPDYIEQIRNKSLTKGGKTARVPALDFIALLERSRAFSDEITVSDLVTHFKADFKLSDSEFEALFEVVSESDAHFFATTPVTADEVIAMVGEPPAPGVKAIGGVLPDFQPDPTSFTAGLSLPSGVAEQAGAALAVGSHLILAGPPGTGKSTLAEELASAATSQGYTAGYMTVTAIADWTTFDTIGGYMPTGSGNELVFREGVILRAIREDGWCVIDELNRANIDRAIGALITLLAGSEVTAVVDLPYQHFVGDGSLRRLVPVRIRRDFGQERSGKDPDSGDYVIGRNWRLVATMNTLDRNNLFPLTAAFARRFATVYVGLPPAGAALTALRVSAGTAYEVFTVLMTEKEGVWTNPRPLGPAIVKDAWRYVQWRLDKANSEGTVLGDYEIIVEALTLYVLPQYSGLAPVDWAPLRDRLAVAAASGTQQASEENIREAIRVKLDDALRGIQGE